jgi:hypothetical protein
MIYKDPAIVHAVAIFYPRMSNFNTRPIRETFLVKTEAKNTRAVRKVSGAFDYPENRSHGLGVNLAASQRRLYCASVNSHSLVGLVIWQ